MIVALQALVFTGCVTLGIFTKAQVDCRFDVPLVVWTAPAPVDALEAAEERSTAVAPADPSPLP